MIDLKQLEYFNMCVKTGSFSEAAQLLYTTQPSVSRVIRALEESLNKVLFERYAKGIRLTEAGREVFQYTRQIMENLEKLEQRTDSASSKELLRVSSNASTWFADCFLSYYLENRKRNIQYQIYTAGTQEVMERIRERRDDLGFVYIIENQLPAFQYALSRNYLVFEELTRTDVFLYYGKHGEPERTEDGVDFKSLRLIQRFPEEYSSDSYWDLRDLRDHSPEEAQTIVTTNSDYIMRKMLSEGDLANISGDYLSDQVISEKAPYGKIRLSLKNDSKMVFGMLYRKEEEMCKASEDFLNYIKKQLKTKER